MKLMTQGQGSRRTTPLESNTREQRSEGDGRHQRSLSGPSLNHLNAYHDVFGDGSVVVISTPDHTVGHQSLFLKLPKTGSLVLSGDLYHYAAERTLNRMPEREQQAGRRNLAQRSTR
jgi:glyoxylase-like metal-dependent hydrolase (beta-lactamase superfamily II)